MWNKLTTQIRSLKAIVKITRTNRQHRGQDGHKKKQQLELYLKTWSLLLTGIMGIVLCIPQGSLSASREEVDNTWCVIVLVRVDASAGVLWVSWPVHRQSAQTTSSKQKASASTRGLSGGVDKTKSILLVGSCKVSKPVSDPFIGSDLVDRQAIFIVSPRTQHKMLQLRCVWEYRFSLPVSSQLVCV